MKNIVEIFRDSFAFKLFAGIVMFFFVNQGSFVNHSSEETEHEVLEIIFQEKFLEINSVYNDHFLTY